MAMEITQILQGSGQNGRSESAQSAQAAAVRDAVRTQQLASQRERQQQLTREQIQQYTQELEQISRAFNKRLSFNYNEELERMVVKVIDGSTDTVIKELPPRELQRVHMRIREAIGLLLDESA